MATDRSRYQVELRRKAVLATPVFEDLAGANHAEESIYQQRSHALPFKREIDQYFLYFQRFTGLIEKLYELVLTGDRVFVRLALSSGLGFFGFNGQVMRLRTGRWAGLTIDRSRLL
jgi:hypothetical protein